MTGRSTTCLIDINGMKIMKPWCDRCGREAERARFSLFGNNRAVVTAYCHGEEEKFECRLDDYGVATPRIGG